MFGQAAEVPQNEHTPFHPRSSYGISKVAGFHLTRNYREAYGMHASSGILFNHESPRRDFEFVTRKITSGVARIGWAGRGAAAGQPGGAARLGPRAGVRAGDVADAATGRAGRLRDRDRRDPPVREFAELAFACAGLDYRKHVMADPNLYRPAEVTCCWGCGQGAAAGLAA